MRINKLWVKEFRNIKNEAFDFSGHKGLTLLIGNNGSGKSNLLEFISYIFDGLISNDKKKFPSDFEIEWTLSDRTIVYAAEYKDGSLKKTIDGVKEDARNKVVFPKRIVAIYSGESNRLWSEVYEPYYLNFVKDINKAASAGSKAPELPRFLYLNKYYWDIALLSLLCSDREDIGTYCKDVLHISSTKSITFTFDASKGYEHFRYSDVLMFAKRFKDKKAYSLEKFIEVVDSGHLRRDDLFEYLYLATTAKKNKIIAKTEVVFNKNLNVDLLSEGLKKELLVKSALEFAAQEDSLFLFDEPDAHVHVSNKEEIAKLVKYFTGNRHIIMTSHSPSLCQSVEGDSIIFMEQGKAQAVKDQIDAGMKLSEPLLKYNVLFNTKHLVLTEGKMDIKYLRKAITLKKDKYPNLYSRVDFLSLGGTDKDVTETFMKKLISIKGRKILRLVDRDEAGTNLAKTLVKAKAIDEQKKFQRILEVKGKRSDLFLLMYPPVGGDFEKDFLVEDYFGHDRLADISQKILDKYKDNKGLLSKAVPRVNAYLKSTALPDFCDNSTDAEDFDGFEVLLKDLETFFS